MPAVHQPRVAALASPQARPHGSLRPCRRCGRPMVSQRTKHRPAGTVRASARGLCRGCHCWAIRTGHLYDYPRITRRAVNVAEDHAYLQENGLNDRQIAERLGMKLDSLQCALRRARTYESTAA